MKYKQKSICKWSKFVSIYTYFLLIFYFGGNIIFNEPELNIIDFLTINTDCQPFIYYSDPGACPAHINCPSAKE